MQTLKALKALNIAEAMKFDDCFRYMRRSKITFDLVSFVSTSLTNALYEFGYGGSFTHASKRNVNKSTTNRTNGRKRTCGLRVFSKVYGMRGFGFAFSAFHRNGVKFHTKALTLELRGWL